MSRLSLPVDEVLPEILAALGRGPNVVLEAPPGAGKTTRVPPALLDAGLGKVLVLEPRRLAARAAARRIAQERGGKVGAEVGYRVRFDSKVSKQTRLEVLTPGVLLRRLQEDPFLEGVGAVMFDEFHERGLDADLALAMVRRVQQEVRPELRLVITSATLDGDAAAAWLGGCEVVRSDGRLFPVEQRYLPREPRDDDTSHVVRGVRAALEAGPGDVLVFLPGVGEIRRVERALEGLARSQGIDLQPLYGDLAGEKQDAALSAGPRRRVVLSTNVAESSVTVEGVATVVDAGLARVKRSDPATGLDRLVLEPVSVASTDQRAGRAGRLGPGLCLRLWSAPEQRDRAPATEPEIVRVDLAGATLQLLAWGEPDPASFPWVEAPPPEALRRALGLLAQLGAVDQAGVLTPLGRSLAGLPAHPRLARLLAAGHAAGAQWEACLGAALLGERDVLERLDLRQGGAAHASDSDVLDRVQALRAYEREGTEHAGPRPLQRGSARAVLRAAEQLSRLATRAFGPEPDRGHRSYADVDEALLRALLDAFPDRLARRRKAGEARALMVGGRGVRLGLESAVTEAELFVCVELDGAGADARVRMASAVERDWIDGGQERISVEAAFDEEREKVVGRRRTYLGPLLLAEHDGPAPDQAEAEALLLEVAQRKLSRVLPMEGSDWHGFLERVRSLDAWMPDLELGAWSEEQLAQLLPGLVGGCRSLADLRQARWLDALRGQLGHRKLAMLEREAPERLRVPSGNNLRLTYEKGRPPVLAARIQEMFGQEDTPRVAGGRVPVLLHLLAPNGRPQQVTDDLGSFWDTTYSSVRRELRRRYPRHSWPEDPRQGVAERRPKRRR